MRHAWLHAVIVPWISYSHAQFRAPASPWVEDFANQEKGGIWSPTLGPGQSPDPYKLYQTLNVRQKLEGMAVLETFARAIGSPGGTLNETLETIGPFTVFAPNEAAFNANASFKEFLMRPENAAILHQVLEYHIAPGRTLTVAEAVALPSGQPITTLGGQPLWPIVVTRTEVVENALGRQELEVFREAKINQASYSYGLYSYSIYSHDLRSHGLHSCGQAFAVGQS